MAGVIQNISEGLIKGYTYLLSSLPNWAQNFTNLFLIILLIFLYSLFVWKLYRFLATKNIFGFDLSQYNRTQNPFLTKFFKGMLYLVEYIIILPLMIFFWFSIFSLFLILLTENLGASLLLSAAIVGAIRIASYYKEELAKELAKLIPFMLLTVSLLNTGFFDIQRILTNIQQIPSFFNNIVIYLVFIVILEIILRAFSFLFSLFGIEEQDETAEEE
jgi:hypothetical protein